MPLTSEPDLHLLVNGIRLDAVTRTPSVSVFTLDSGSATVRLCSRAAVPQEFGTARDPRCLGVGIRRIAVRQGTRFRVATAGDAGLTDGFHRFERETGLRWTDGDAALPAALFAGFAGRMELVVDVGATTQYADDGSASRAA